MSLFVVALSNSKYQLILAASTRMLFPVLRMSSSDVLVYMSNALRAGCINSQYRFIIITAVVFPSTHNLLPQWSDIWTHIIEFSLILNRRINESQGKTQDMDW